MVQALETLWESIGRPTVRALIFDRNERVLLIQRGPGLEEGLYCVPGGKLDGFERGEAAIRREVWEEVGLPFTPLQFGVQHETGQDSKLYAVAYFGGPLEGIPHVDGVEAVDLAWSTLYEILHRTDLAFNRGKGLKEMCEAVLKEKLVPTILSYGTNAAVSGSNVYK